ncbi:MAG: Hsp70 family protein [Rickettsia sp.]|nr:Hsp70 family protein [Rickettsia sp.]
MSPEIINIIDRSKKKGEIALGIDFGTTNSLIATFSENNLKIIPDHLNRDVLPSIISWNNLEKIIIGTNILDKGWDCVYSIKRFLGKSSTELLKNINSFSISDKNLLDLTVDDDPRIKIGAKKLSPYILVSYILKFLKNSAEEFLKTSVKQIVLSVPAYFDNKAKSELLNAANNAGLNVLRLIAEPTAAAYAYNLHKIQDGKYIVYDLGGGTFDVSILNIECGILQVLNVKGDNLLGGDDIDEILLQYFLDKSILEGERDKIFIKIKHIKEILSFQDNIKIGNVFFSRKEFETLILPFVNKTIRLLEIAILESEVEEFSGIILVGGASKMPCIKNKIKEKFPQVKIYDFLDPDKVVAMGAAMHAEHLTNADFINPSLIVDVIPLSIGIELYGGIMEKIILRNTPLPYSVTKEFTTFVDNQTAIKIKILQGEREFAKDCIFLGFCELSNLEPKFAGQVKVEMTFHVDVNGILYLSAKDKNNVTNFISHEINIFKDLNKKMINDVLDNSYQNAKLDYNQTLLHRAKLDAILKIREVKKFLLSDTILQDKTEMISNIEMLNNFIAQDDYENILSHMDLLNKSVEDFLRLYKS